MNEIENDFKKICYPNEILKYKNCFQEDEVNFPIEKFAMKTENVNFLTSCVTWYNKAKRP